MTYLTQDDDCCQYLCDALSSIFPDLRIEGGVEEPFYQAPKENQPAVLRYTNNYPRSLLHELSHYCLAGESRRQQDDFGYWYTPCGRTAEEQKRFEKVEARPQGLERVLCELLGLKFSLSLDDFSGHPITEDFEQAYKDILKDTPPTAKKLIAGLNRYISQKGRPLLNSESVI